MKVEPRAKAQERAAEADRRALEKHEFARHRQASALGLQGAHHLADLAAAVFRRLDAVGGGAHAIVENRPAHETRPHGHRLGHAGREPRKAPHREGVRDSRLVVRLQRPIELDHAVHEPRRKNAHAAVVEQIDAIDPTLAALRRRRDRIIAEMRIAVNDAVAQERAPPRVEQADGDGVARFLRRALEGDERLAVEPLHRQQSPRRQALLDPRHAHERPVGEHDAIEPGDLGLALVVELFAHPLADLARHLAGVDRCAGAPMKREQKVEIGEIGLHRRGHVRILQLAGESLAAEAYRSMHLAERRGGRGLQIEFGETLAPVWPKLGLHAPAHERGAHWRRLRLELRQFGGKIRRHARRGWWSASAPPSSAAPSSSPRRKRAPWRRSRGRPRAAG